MSKITDAWIQTLQAGGLKVVDLRGKLPTHPTKVFATREVSALKGLVLHQSLTDVDEDLKEVTAIARYHTGPNHISRSGCPGICYTAAIGSCGEVYLCHDLEVATYSQGTNRIPGNENADYLGIVVLGRFYAAEVQDGRQPTPIQLWAAARLYDLTAELFAWTLSNHLFGHFDFGKPACPGDALRSLILVVRGDWIVNLFPRDLRSIRGRQVALRDMGHDPGPTDGRWGPRSKAALVAFQREQGLEVDGLWGPKTEVRARMVLGERS